MARITIDYTPALRQTAGIGRYTRGLIAGLAEVGVGRHQLTLFCAGNSAGHEQPPPGFRVRTTRLPSRWLTAGWQRLHLPLPAEWLAGPCDIFHSPDFSLPPLVRARGVVTIHDLSFLRVPACADPRLRAYLERAVPRAVQIAHRVLADSANTRNDLVALLGVPESRLSVVHGGVEPRFRRVTCSQELERARERYRLPERYIFGIGTLEPRKNFAGLIRAYASLYRRHPGLPPHLVIAGKPGWLYDDIYAAVEQERVAERVHFVGFVADCDLPALYSLADMLAFPSRYEGFGLPPLEAMACGVPVIAAANSSLPETIGEAGLLIDCEDTHELSQAMERALEDQDLRRRLAELGPAQAAHFSWAAAARELVAAYELALR